MSSHVKHCKALSLEKAAENGFDAPFWNVKSQPLGIIRIIRADTDKTNLALTASIVAAVTAPGRVLFGPKVWRCYDSTVGSTGGCWILQVCLVLVDLAANLSGSFF